MKGKEPDPKKEQLWKSLMQSRVELFANALRLYDAYATFVTEVEKPTRFRPLLSYAIIVALPLDAVYLQIWALLCFDEIIGFHRELVSHTKGTLITRDNADAFRSLLYMYSRNTDNAVSDK